MPLTKAANGSNGAISLTQTFDRILFYVFNSLNFGVQEEKNGDRGTIVFTATLKHNRFCTVYLKLYSTLVYGMDKLEKKRVHRSTAVRNHHVLRQDILYRESKTSTSYRGTSRLLRARFGDLSPVRHCSLCATYATQCSVPGRSSCTPSL